MYAVGNGVPVRANMNTNSPFSHTPSSDPTRTYYVTIFDGTATYTSNQVTVTVNPRPSAGSLSSSADYDWLTTDPLFPLSPYVVTGSGSGDVGLNVSFSGASVISDHFYPSVGPGSFSPNYTITNSYGCSVGPTAFTTPIIVESASISVPSLFDPANSTPFPFCEGSASNALRVALPGKYISRVTINYSSGAVIAYNGTAIPSTTSDSYVPTNPSFVDLSIDMSLHPAINTPLSVTVAYNTKTGDHVCSGPIFLGNCLGTYYDHYAPGSSEAIIPTYPSRIISFVGFPKAGPADTVLICASNQDTITVRAVPGGGSFEYFKIEGGIETQISGFNDYYEVPSDRNTLFRYVPARLFEDSALSNYNTYFKVRYMYPGVSSGTCPGVTEKIIKFNRPQDIQYAFKNAAPYCDGEIMLPAIYNNTGNDSASYFISYGDGFSTTFNDADTASISHKYAAPGKYLFQFKSNVLTTVTADSTCNVYYSDSIFIGSQPMAKFTAKDLIVNRATNFEDISILLDSNKAVANDTIFDWQWTFSPTANFHTNDYRDSIVSHTYNQVLVNPYAVSLVVKTNPHPGTALTYGCKDSISRYIPIFPIDTPRISEVYRNNFSVAGNGWYQSGSYRIGGNSSWQQKSPTGTTINDPTNVAWITDNGIADSLYNFSEFSWVESPAFYLDSLALSHLSFRTWVKSENQLDGACIQWAFADTTFGNEHWKTIGYKDQGIGWYSSNIIVSMIGQVKKINTFTPGWTGQNNRWIESKIRIDDVVAEAGSRPVRFRILFSSNADNSPGKYDGFAFDDFSLGYRNRQILIEEFVTSTEMDNGSVSAKVQSDSQAVNIKYFIGHLGQDDINDLNRADPSARALTYGIDRVQRAVIDGTISQNDVFSAWGNAEYDKQLLNTSDFDIYPTVVQQGGRLRVDARITRKGGSTKLNNRAFIVQVAVLSDHDTIPNVLRKMLPNAAGTFFQRYNWASQLVVDSLYYSPITSLANLSKFKIVVFLQDHISYEVYQTAQVEYSLADPINNPLIPLPDPAITQGANLRTFDGIPPAILYPQPSLNDVTVEFNTPLLSDVNYSIRNSLGIELKKGTFRSGEDTFRLVTNNLVSGTYSIVLNSSNHSTTISFIQQ
jgi:hypothetical protein